MCLSGESLLTVQKIVQKACYVVQHDILEQISLVSWSSSIIIIICIVLELLEGQRLIA